MEQKEAFEKIIEILNITEADYMITGGFAVSFWGEPRATHVLDIVIDVLPGAEKKIATAFNNAGFMADEYAIKEAVSKKVCFNIIHLDSDFKVDCWAVKGDEYNRERFSRKLGKKLFGYDTFLITPEDLILTKLKWFKDSDSSRHFMDAIGVVKTQKDLLDVSYLNKWAPVLDVSELLKDLLLSN